MISVKLAWTKSTHLLHSNRTALHGTAQFEISGSQTPPKIYLPESEPKLH